MDENQPPHPVVWASVAYLNPAFELNPQTPKRFHMDFWSACLVLIYLHPHQLYHPNLLQQQLLEPRVSILSFQLWWFFFGGLPFALLVLQCRAAFSTLSFSKYVMRVALSFGPLAPRLAASAIAHLSDRRTVPWPLVLKLLASAELCSTRPASPAWSSREPSDLSGLVQGDPLGLLQDVPWELSRNP